MEGILWFLGVFIVGGALIGLLGGGREGAIGGAIVGGYHGCGCLVQMVVLALMLLGGFYILGLIFG